MIAIHEFTDSSYLSCNGLCVISHPAPAEDNSSCSHSTDTPQEFSDQGSVYEDVVESEDDLGNIKV